MNDYEKVPEVSDTDWCEVCQKKIRGSVYELDDLIVCESCYTDKLDDAEKEVNPER